MKQCLERLLYGAKRSFDLALGSSSHAPAVAAFRHVSADIDAELRHHVAKNARFRDRAIVRVNHPGDALQHQFRLLLWRHGIEQEAKTGRRVLAVDTAIFLIGDAATVIDDAEQ